MGLGLGLLSMPHIGTGPGDGQEQFFADTHNTAEGGGAAALAALIQERERMRGKNVAVILSGGNVDTSLFGAILSQS